MAKKRYINTKFWDDNYVVELDPIEKLLFLYFLTNPLTDICGIYEAPIRRVAFDTGIDKDMLLKIIDRFSKDRKVYYINGWIYVKNFAKHQAVNESVEKGIERSISLVPDVILAKIKEIDTACNSLGASCDLPKPILKPKPKPKPKGTTPKISILLIKALLEEMRINQPDGDYKLDNIFPGRLLAKKIEQQLKINGVKKIDNDLIIKSFRQLINNTSEFHRKNITSIKYVNKNFNKIMNDKK